MCSKNLDPISRGKENYSQNKSDLHMENTLLLNAESKQSNHAHFSLLAIPFDVVSTL